MKRRSESSLGLLNGLSAYLIWGSFPLIIAAASFADPFEVVVWRVVFGFVFSALLVSIGGGWNQIVQIVRSPLRLRWVGVAALFIYLNWVVYVVAVATGNVIESSLGYFINPLVTVLFAVLLLKEKLRGVQWVALGVGALAVIILTIDYGRLPLIAIALAVSFGIYSLAKNRVGKKISALQSFTIESGLVVPIALIQLWLVSQSTQPMIFSGVRETGILLGFAVLTALALILFGAAASRVPLSTIGFIQYLSPTIQFLIGYFVFGEPMTAVRWIGFGLVWASLVILSTDALGRRRSDVPIIEQS